MKPDYMFFNEALASSAVIRGADGVPTAFRVLTVGTMEFTADGQTMKMLITPAMLGEIAGFAEAKGMIPLDCEHFLAHLASATGVEESQLLAEQPLLGEAASPGMVSLALNDQGELWAKVEKLAARARTLLSGQGEKLYTYFSPYFRGLVNGPRRMTSIALTNRPAMNGLDSLAATDGRPFVASAHQPNPEKKHMKINLVALLAAAGVDAQGFTDDNAQGFVDRAVAKLTEQGGALKSIRDSLGLTDADPANIVAGKVVALAEKSKADALALTDAQTKLAGFEADKRKALLDDAEKAGKLTAPLRKFAEANLADTKALTDYLGALPVIVPQGSVADKSQQASGDEKGLTDDQIEVAEALGITDLEAYAKRTGRVYKATAKAG